MNNHLSQSNSSPNSHLPDMSPDNQHPHSMKKLSIQTVEEALQTLEKKAYQNSLPQNIQKLNQFHQDRKFHITSPFFPEESQLTAIDFPHTSNDESCQQGESSSKIWATGRWTKVEHYLFLEGMSVTTNLFRHENIQKELERRREGPEDKE